MKPSISIIVTAYNTHDYIEECLDSIEGQTYFEKFKQYEILLGIDGCENTLKKVLDIKHKYRNLRIFMMSQNKGTYVTSNTLISVSKYDNILRFDSDDIMCDNMVEKLINNSDGYHVISMKYYNFNNNNDKKLPSKAFTQGVLFYKKDILKKVEGYRPWLCAADAEFILRIRKNGFRIKNLDKFLFERRTHNKSLTKNKKTSWSSELRKKYIKDIKKYSIMDLNDINFEFVKNDYIEY